MAGPHQPLGCRIRPAPSKIYVCMYVLMLDSTTSTMCLNSPCSAFQFVRKSKQQLKALFFLHTTQHCKGGEGKLLNFFMFQVRKTATAPRFC